MTQTKTLMREGIRKQIMKFDYETRRTVNCIKFDVKSGKKHKMSVVRICMGYIMDGTPFYTRARHYRTGRVADIYNIPLNYIIEIQHNESGESIEKKRRFWEGEGYNFDAVRV